MADPRKSMQKSREIPACVSQKWKAELLDGPRLPPPLYLKASSIWDLCARPPFWFFFCKEKRRREYRMGIKMLYILRAWDGEICGVEGKGYPDPDYSFVAWKLVGINMEREIRFIFNKYHMYVIFCLKWRVHRIRLCPPLLISKYRIKQIVLLSSWIVILHRLTERFVILKRYRICYFSSHWGKWQQ